MLSATERDGTHGTSGTPQIFWLSYLGHKHSQAQGANKPDRWENCIQYPAICTQTPVSSNHYWRSNIDEEEEEEKGSILFGPYSRNVVSSYKNADATRKKMERLLSENKLPRMASSVKKAMIALASIMIAAALAGVLVHLFTRLNQGGMCADNMCEVLSLPNCTNKQHSCNPLQSSKSDNIFCPTHANCLECYWVWSILVNLRCWHHQAQGECHVNIQDCAYCHWAMQPNGNVLSWVFCFLCHCQNCIKTQVHKEEHRYCTQDSPNTITQKWFVVLCFCMCQEWKWWQRWW